MHWIQFFIQFLLDVESLPSSIDTLSINQSHPEARQHLQLTTLCTAIQRKVADSLQRKRGATGRGAGSGAETEAEWQADQGESQWDHCSVWLPPLRSASSRRHVAQRKISSSLQTEAEGTLGNLTSANKHAAFFFLSCKQKKCIWCWFRNWVWIWKTSALGLFLDTHCDLSSLMRFTTKCNHTHTHRK